MKQRWVSAQEIGSVFLSFLSRVGSAGFPDLTNTLLGVALQVSTAPTLTLWNGFPRKKPKTSPSQPQQDSRANAAYWFDKEWLLKLFGELRKLALIRIRLLIPPHIVNPKTEPPSPFFRICFLVIIRLAKPGHSSLFSLFQRLPLLTSGTSWPTAASSANSLSRA